VPSTCRRGSRGAIRCYLADADAVRPGWRYPNHLRDRDSGGGVELEVSVEWELWRALELEAERQDVSTAQLIEHVALYYGTRNNTNYPELRIIDGR